MKQVYDVIQIQAPSLKNNRLGDSIVRDVLVLLPESYCHNRDKDYPVVYLLHGFGESAERWFSDALPDPTLHLTSRLLTAQEKIGEMIYVLPENGCRFTCAGYNNNDIQGNWLDYICIDLIHEIESRYRCLNGPENRALIGHSSGGDAVLRLALKKPGYFSTYFAMSCAQLYAGNNDWLVELYTSHFEQLIRVQQGKLPVDSLDIYAHLLVNLAQQALPDKASPPLFIQLPINEEDWHKFTPLYGLNLFEHYGQNLNEVNLAMDAGFNDLYFSKIKSFAQLLKDKGVDIDWFEFDGGHVDHMGENLNYVLPWVWRCLLQDKQ
ncbi:alpha/beta hydrolase [Psychromonas aquimarina]|uniref:alpha/beta hydrolase n=1 Tax=Psychromonas aquimarina TaxID=444919 RepID=UPI00041DEB5C|nr:alpha/beta hydrolase-fold protein [Psychromonas aquimarina]